jgi:hypothetical protein
MNSFKQIKITNDHAHAIETALAITNGRAHQHAFTTYQQIADLADYGERRLRSMGLPKSARPGAVVIATSGDEMPRAYRYRRYGTRVRLVRRSSGWHLDAAETVVLWPQDCFKPELHLTVDQDAEAVRRFRGTYSAPSALPASMPIDDVRRLAASLDTPAQRVVEWLSTMLTQPLHDEVRSIIRARDARTVSERVLAEICDNTVDTLPA